MKMFAFIEKQEETTKIHHYKIKLFKIEDLNVELQTQV